MKTKLNILSVIMLTAVASVVGTVSVSAQTHPDDRVTDRTVRPVVRELSGKLKIRKDFGVVPLGPGNSQPAYLPCGQFYVAVLDPANGNKSVVTTSMSGQGPDEGEFYTCKYSMMVPTGKPFYIVAGMGGALLLPKEDRSPQYITDAWIGGTRNKPPRGYERAFPGKYLTMGANKGTWLTFELAYVRVEPN